MQTALLLIDVQQSFMHRPYWGTDDVPAFLAHTNALVAGCAERGVPVVRIFHTDGPRNRVAASARHAPAHHCRHPRGAVLRNHGAPRQR